jgi:hypothetical protein
MATARLPDIVLQLNAVDLPQTRFDGNNFYFDLLADGSINTGSGDAFVDTINGSAAARKS